MIPTLPATSRRRWPRGALAQRGATIVEFAIIAPAFLMLMIGVIELSMVYFANLTMQHAVREGALCGHGPEQSRPEYRKPAALPGGAAKDQGQLDGHV